MARYELSKINKVRTFGTNINFKTRLHLFSVIAKTRDLERGKFDWSGVYPVSGYKVDIFIQNQFVQSRNCPRYQ